MKYKKMIFSLALGAALTVSPFIAQAQDFSGASEEALDALKDGSQDYAQELIPSQASGSALLDVSGFGSSEEDAEQEINIKYKYNPKKGPKGLQGAHMPERIFRVPYSGRP